MSAFMVNDGTIDRAVSAIVEFDAALPSGEAAYFPPDEVGRLLIKLNMEALRQRYGDAPLAFTYTHREHADEHKTLARLKACECLKYQCSEGSVPESTLYKLLQAVIEDLEHQVVHERSIPRENIPRLSVYEALPWDFDD